MNLEEVCNWRQDGQGATHKQFDLITARQLQRKNIRKKKKLAYK